MSSRSIRDRLGDPTSDIIQAESSDSDDGATSFHNPFDIVCPYP